MYRIIQPIEWKEISKAIQYTFFMLKWNIILERFGVTNRNSQSPQFDVCHAVKIFSSLRVYMHGISINNLIKAEFASARKYTNFLFNARRVLLMYRHFTYQKGDLICLQLSEPIYFYWYSLCNTERNVMEMDKGISVYCQLRNKFQFSQEVEMPATSMATTHR